MGRRVVADEWDDDDDWRADDSDSSDDELPTIECPYCDREVAEDTPQCPYCRAFVSEEDAPPRRQPVWIIVVVLICFYIVYRWTVG